MFVQQANDLVDYWAKADLSSPEMVASHQGDELRWRLSGVVHSIFAAMDGAAIGIPSFELKAIEADSEDIEDRKGTGLKEFSNQDISGNLASDFFAMNKPDHPLANFKKEYQKLYSKHMGFDKFL